MTTYRRLAPNFYLHEFERSSRAARLGINNAVPDALLPNLVRIATVMQSIRGILGNRVITVTSGYRCLALNSQTPGSSTTSAHTKGLACDFIVQGMTPQQVCLILKEHVQELGIDQLILEFGQWSHVGLREGEPRHQIFSYANRQGRTVKLGGITL